MNHKLNIVLTDKSVEPLLMKQKSTVNEFVKKYDLDPNVFIFETLHGHIAKMCRKEGSFFEHDKDKPCRMNNDDIEFLADIRSEIRWIEMSKDYINIGI